MGSLARGSGQLRTPHSLSPDTFGSFMVNANGKMDRIGRAPLDMNIVATAKHAGKNLA